MNKKKVLVFTTQLLETGGIESHLKEFCVQLNDSNLNISILVLNSKASEPTAFFYKNLCENAWIISNKNILVRYLKLLLLLPILNLKGYDTFYSNGQGDSIYYLKKMLFSIKYWVHHHHTSGNELDQKTWSKNYLKTLQKANLVVACANKNANLMSQELKRNVISIPCFSRKIIIDNKPINPKKIKLAYIGRLIKEKGIEAICELSNRKDLDYIQFIIWGEGNTFPPSYFKSYPNVEYMGLYSNTDGLKNALNNIDAFILYTTHPEGLPISLLEVMSAGIPWIATKTGGISEISIDSELNYLLPQDSNFDDLVNHLKLFTSNLISKQSIYTKQIAAYNKIYSTEIVSQNWVNVLSNKSLK